MNSFTGIIKGFLTPCRTVFLLEHLSGCFCKLCEVNCSEIIDNNIC